MNTSPKIKYFRVIDLFVLVIFLSTAVYGLYLFREDLLRTFDARDAEPAGFVVIRDNIVQRRFEDRVLWDRLNTKSYVYSGDLIRAADLSSALLEIGANEIFLGENTLIRIQHDPTGQGPLRVELREGRVNITGREEDSSQEVYLEYMGSEIQAQRGAVLDAEVIANTIAVYVSQGTASIKNANEEARNIEQGEMLVINETGQELETPAEEIQLAPIRIFRSETIASMTETLRETANNQILDAIRLREATLQARKAETETLHMQNQDVFYTVVAGDSLGRIAIRFYGNASMYLRIAEANNIRNPDLIYIGQVFIIP